VTIIEWYFPESGGSFNPDVYLDVCARTFHDKKGLLTWRFARPGLPPLEQVLTL
jgi:hypothetical protein